MQICQKSAKYQRVKVKTDRNAERSTEKFKISKCTKMIRLDDLFILMGAVGTERSKKSVEVSPMDTVGLLKTIRYDI